MLIDNDFYSRIIPDDGLISDFALEMRLHDTYLLEELLIIEGINRPSFSGAELAHK